VPLPPVYSELVAAAAGASAGATVLGGPDTGFRWVIVDIALEYQSTDSVALAGARLVDENGYLFFEVHQPFAISGNSYHWNGRQVLDVPNELILDAVEAGWGCRVSGYVLSLP
jgi:hypothetical protein